ncbi:hypothetical protein IJI31_01005 [bacterium]|nr:hypothetical protein [bacterium]
MKTEEEIKGKWYEINKSASDLTISDIEFIKLYGFQEALKWVLEEQ